MINNKELTLEIGCQIGSKEVGTVPCSTYKIDAAQAGYWSEAPLSIACANVPAPQALALTLTSSWRSLTTPTALLGALDQAPSHFGGKMQKEAEVSLG